MESDEEGLLLDDELLLTDRVRFRELDRTALDTRSCAQSCRGSSTLALAHSLLLFDSFILKVKHFFFFFFKG